MDEEEKIRMCTAHASCPLYPDILSLIKTIEELQDSNIQLKLELEECQEKS